MSKYNGKTWVTVLVSAVTVISFSATVHGETRFAVQDAAGINDKMVVTDSGNIGVGITVPVAGIHVKGVSFPNNTVKVEGSEVPGGGGFLGYHVKTNGTLPVTNDRLGFMLFGSVSGINALHGAGLSAKADGIWTTSSYPASFAFETAGTSGGRIERMRVSSNGNVGIGSTFGATAPSQRLEIDGGVRFSPQSAKPVTCDASVRGTVWFTRGGTDVADTLEVCAKDGGNSYAWRKIY